jgi:hypothetical protein
MMKIFLNFGVGECRKGNGTPFLKGWEKIMK